MMMMMNDARVSHDDCNDNDDDDNDARVSQDDCNNYDDDDLSDG